MHLFRKIIPTLAFLLALPTLTSAQTPEKITPLMLNVQDAPIPFQGSDARTHLVYELELKNFSSGALTIEQLEVLAPDNSILQTLDAKEIATRLQLAGHRDSTAVMPPSTLALLFIHVTMPAGQPAPARLAHRVRVNAEAAPPGQNEITETGGEIAVDAQPVAVIGPPLRGANYISADSCCDATRHTRAALPVNGRVWIAQRYAVDWEQLDAGGRIYTGPREKLESYAIFGQPVLAVANALVVTVIDGQPEQTPGNYPKNIGIEDADGNSVILDLGNRHYALYAHMQPGSIKVHRGEHVHPGQVIGLVGDTGNSIVPHLHLQVTDGPSGA